MININKFNTFVAILKSPWNLDLGLILTKFVMSMVLKRKIYNTYGQNTNSKLEKKSAFFQHLTSKGLKKCMKISKIPQKASKVSEI